VDPRLLDILVCPVTKGSLTYDKAAQELISKSARLAYPIRDGIPIMLESEARVLDDPTPAGPVLTGPVATGLADPDGPSVPPAT